MRFFLLLMLLWVPCVSSGSSFLEKARALDAAGKMPGLARDGIVLPRALLLDELKKKLDSKKIEIRDLLLSDGKGTVVLISKNAFDAEIRIDFEFLDVDWPNRTVWVRYSESTHSASDTVLGRVFGTIAIAAFEAASGSGHVAERLEGKPYYKIKKDEVGILLDRIPSLEKPLALRVGHVRLFDLIGIKRIKTEKDGIHVALGLV